MFSLNRQSGESIKPVVFISLDGWGIAPPSRGNAVYLAKTPNYLDYLKRYPHTEIIASGESVGLPANEVGNSEVGHLTMGVGRVIFQSLERINLAIQEETIFRNQQLLNMMTYLKTKGATLHLLGLVGSGNVHSSLPHLYAILEFCKRSNFSKVLIHVITDGRDSPPQEAKVVIEELEQKLREEYGLGKIASVQGRYYGMDRDGRWERIKAGYDVVVKGQGKTAAKAVEALKETYGQGKSDEFVPPQVIVSPGNQPHRVENRDVLMFFNFRVDRAREMTMALTMPDFEQINPAKYGFDPNQAGFALGSQGGALTFRRDYWPAQLKVVTMTEYQKGLPVTAVVFPPEERIDNSVSHVIARVGWQQLKLAESEKERMVTYYFDGLQDPFTGEKVVIVPSPKVATYDQKPEMAAFEIVKTFKGEIRKNLYRFVMINFANPDMVAHTGNLQATIKAVSNTDKAMGEIVKETLKRDGLVVITADHGNSEELITFPTGNFFYTTSQGTVNTDHSNNPVPLMIIGKAWEGKKLSLPKGVMSDVAPTLLTLMGLPVPPDMTGKVLISGNVS